MTRVTFSGQQSLGFKDHRPNEQRMKDKDGNSPEGTVPNFCGRQGGTRTTDMRILSPRLLDTHRPHNTLNAIGVTTVGARAITSIAENRHVLREIRIVS